MKRKATVLLSLLSATAVLGTGAFTGVAALPIPLDPRDPAVSQQWINPGARATDEATDVEIELLELHHPDGTPAIRPGAELRARVEITNRTADELTEITLSVQRQAAAADTAAARVALTATTFPYFGPTEVLGDTLAPGESTVVELRVPTDPALGGSLGITDPGAYPVRIALSGQLNGVATHLDSQRFVLPVGGTTPGDPAETTPTTLIYPISAQTHMLGGETGESPEDPPLLLASEDLADELGPQGRLTGLVDAYLAAPPTVRAASCLAVDPQLLEVVERMSGGYTVTAERTGTAPQNQRLRDLWTATNQPEDSEEGRGAAAATDFLVKLRTAAADSCTVALPWANTDLNAVGDTGNQWLMREALQRGSTTLNEILGVAPLDNVVIPGSGYVDPTTATSLGWADSTDPTQTTPEQAWEAQARSLTPAPDLSGQTALDDPTPTHPGTAAPTPATPVSVLVAENTVWRTPAADRFHALAPGITAVTYQGSLSATLAALGPEPETVGYANPESRYDQSLDSPAARALTGQAALGLSVTGGDPETPVLIMPPGTLGAADAGMLLDTTAELLATGQARPFSLAEYLLADATQREDLATAVTVEGLPDDTAFGMPFTDPTVATDTEILRASQQAAYIDDLTGIMHNDPAISLTRYGFTTPLRQDLLRALSLNHRRSLIRHAGTTAAAEVLLTTNRDILQQLRSSVALAPPGNVYTRTSNSSPLIIVAQNGLPLPVETQIEYTGPADARVNTPGVVRVPALGSITLQMTADLPDDNRRTDLTLWLASPEGATISDPVQISVQPRPSVTGTMAIVALGILLLGTLLVFRVFRGRRPGTANHSTARAGNRSGAPAQPGPDRAAGRRTGTPGAARIRGAGPTRPPRRAQGSARDSGHGGQADEGTGSPKPPGGN